MAEKGKKVQKEKVEPIVIESPVRQGMSDTTKGIIIGVLVTALIAVLVVLLILGGKDNDSRNTDVNKETSNSANKNLVAPEDYSDAMKEFYKYFESEEKTLIVFASSQCSYCVAQEPIVEALAEQYDINYLYMDYLELGSDDEINQVIAELELSGGSTPTSVVVQNGEVLDSWVGYVDGSGYVSNLVSAGVLKKGTTYTLEKDIESIDFTKFKNLLNGSKVSAVVVDTPICAICYKGRLELNKIAEKYDVPVYRLSSDVLSEDEMDKFIDGLGDWGYDAEEYKEEKNVQVPLLLFVKNGKIVRYEIGYSEGKTNFKNLFEKVGLID